MKNAIVIDGDNLLWTAYWSVVEGRDGEPPTNAINGFIMMLLSILNRFNGRPIVVWDGYGDTYRDKLSEKYVSKGVLRKLYKAQRHKDQMHSTNCRRQKGYLIKAVEILGISQMMKDGVEADDIVAFLASELPKRGCRVTIVSRDRDFYCLLKTGKVRQWDGSRIWRRSHLEFSPKKLLDIGAIAGDSSDNIEGIYGIGPIGAKRIIKAYGSLRQILDDADNLSWDDKLLAKLLKNKRKVIACFNLKRLYPRLGRMTIPDSKPPNISGLAKLLKRLEIEGIPILRFQQLLEIGTQND